MTMNATNAPAPTHAAATTRIAVGQYIFCMGHKRNPVKPSNVGSEKQLGCTDFLPSRTCTGWLGV